MIAESETFRVDESIWWHLTLHDLLTTTHNFLFSGHTGITTGNENKEFVLITMNKLKR